MTNLFVILALATIAGLSLAVNAVLAERLADSRERERGAARHASSLAGQLKRRQIYRGGLS